MLLCKGALSQDAAQLRDLRIVGHHFTISICGVPQQLGVKDPTVGRWLVLKLTATADGQARLFSHDFVLRYHHADGTEDRASCDGIAECETDKPGEFNVFRTNTEPSVTLQGPRLYFGLAAYVESDVKEIELCRVGGSMPLRYHIGSRRPFSVYVTTNEAAARINALRTMSSANNVPFIFGVIL